MIEIHNMLNIVCTEAIEDDGIPEVPDHKHGAEQNYWAPKRNARATEHSEAPRRPQQLPTLRYDLELVQDENGKVRWCD